MSVVKFPNSGIMVGPHHWCPDCKGVGQFRIDSVNGRVPFKDCVRCRGIGVIFYEGGEEFPGLNWMDVPLVRSEDVNYSKDSKVKVHAAS